MRQQILPSALEILWLVVLLIIIYPVLLKKQMIAVGSIADELIAHMQKNGAYLISTQMVERLMSVILTLKEEKMAAGCIEKTQKVYGVNKDFVGKDAKYILSKIGVDVPDSIRGSIV